MKFRPFVLLTVVTLVIATSLPVLAAPGEEVQQSNRVLQEFTSQSTSNDSNRRIPQSILRDAKGIIVLTNVTRGGFLFFGGRRGDGVMITRTQSGGWSNPLFVNVTGGSFGPQMGGSSSDHILVLMTQESVDRVLRDKLDVGGDVSVAAGPVGGQVVSPVADPTSSIYGYSRSRGLYAGVSLSGTKIAFDDKKTAKYYGRESITSQEVITGNNLTIPAEATALRASLAQYDGANLAAQQPEEQVNPMPAQPMPSIPASPEMPPTRVLW
jgi:lipid-binding SYLF domain-containing protein